MTELFFGRKVPERGARRVGMKSEGVGVLAGLIPAEFKLAMMVSRPQSILCKGRELDPFLLPLIRLFQFTLAAKVDGGRIETNSPFISSVGFVGDRH